MGKTNVLQLRKIFNSAFFNVLFGMEILVHCITLFVFVYTGRGADMILCFTVVRLLLLFGFFLEQYAYRKKQIQTNTYLQLFVMLYMVSFLLKLWLS